MSVGYRIRMFYPKILLIFFILAGFAPIDIKGLSYLMPYFDLIIVFYWSIYRSDTMPSLFLFIAGILKDALLASPLGISAIIYLVIKSLASSKKDSVHKPQFSEVWKKFMITLIVSILVWWSILSILNGQMINIRYSLTHILATVIFYPVLHSMCNKILLILPRQRIDA